MLAETRLENRTTDTLVTIFGEQAKHLTNIIINNFEAMKIEGKSYNAEKRIEELQQKWFYFNIHRYTQKYRNISRILLSVNFIIEVEDEAIKNGFNRKNY
ncbi:hypothetical protein AXF42_Ash007875 [Apostasia shenzhenica]|uniref:Replication factor A C-terminal domain-containing protein n=1 Tax=Apostasia shenzhenica TaxID=1088818 RepID=A0A2I0B5L7_9ASPA|nr:hypothetical protein AXF42_Ash007875 [Apostasia shenzhenica]